MEGPFITEKGSQDYFLSFEFRVSSFPKKVADKNHLQFRRRGLNLRRMRPDHPNKIFNDKRDNYICLMESLATDSLLSL